MGSTAVVEARPLQQQVNTSTNTNFSRTNHPDYFRIQDDFQPDLPFQPLPNLSIFETFPILSAQDIQHGDLLFPRGSDWESQIIESACTSIYSHVGTVIRVTPSFVEILNQFVKKLKINWQDIGYYSFSSSKTTSNIGKSLLTEGVLEGNSFHNSSLSQLNPSFTKEQKSFDDWLSWFESMHKMNPNKVNDTFHNHVIKVILAFEYLKMDTQMMAAIMREVQLENNPPHYLTEEDDDEQKELYYWESTTDTEMYCMIKNDTSSGVKLTKLVDRVCGYQGVIGIRRVLYKQVSLGQRPTMDYHNMLCGFVCNVILNHHKPYQENYLDMVGALLFAKYVVCGIGSSCNPGSIRSEEEENDCFYYSCQPQAFSNDYHFVHEYDSLYCTEMSMQLLLDYQILWWFEEMEQDLMSRITQQEHNQQKMLRGGTSRVFQNHFEVSEGMKHYLAPFYYTQPSNHQSLTPEESMIITEGGEFFFTFKTNNLKPNRFYNAQGAFVEKRGQNLTEHKNLNLNMPGATNSLPKYQLTKTPVSWVGMSFLVESIMNKLANLTPNHRGPPRTGVEVFYMSSVTKIPVDFAISPLVNYRRIQLGLESAL